MSEKDGIGAPIDAGLGPRAAHAVKRRLLRIRELHDAQPSGGLGYLPGGYDYGLIEPCCPTCGTPDEYAEPWPCETRQHVDAALSAWPDES